MAAANDDDGEIRRVLDQHEPPLDEEIREYLVSLLADVRLDDDEDEIRSTLEQFIDATACEAILRSLSSAKPLPGGSRPSAGGMLGADPTTTDTTTTPTLPVPVAALPVVAPPHQGDTGGETEEPPPKSHKETQKAPKSHKELRRARRAAKKRSKPKPNKPDPERSSSSEEEEEGDLPADSAHDLDDHASAWKERRAEGKQWGGRGHGGRGLRYNSGENLANLHLPSVSLQFAGNELLVDSPMDIVRGHRYGLLGRNGVGKSTLLRQLANHGIPGMPHGMRILLVSQQIEGREDQTTLESLVEADEDRTALLAEQEAVEANLEQGIDVEQSAERLGDILAELDAIDSDNAEDRATKILKGLSFTAAMIHSPTANLSGGWRMRLALARALFVPRSDLILLDEVSNHLDLHGMDWLIRYLTNDPQQQRTLLVVSHDRGFLDAVCTDIVVMAKKRLTYHVGNYSEYRRQVDEKTARQAQILDASERQRAKAMAFVQKHQNTKKSTDPKKQRQAKMIKEKKLERIGNYREDGKRWQQFSLKTMDFSSARLAEKVHIEKDDSVLRLHFPNPTWPPGISEGDQLVRFGDASFRYDSSEQQLLKGLTLTINRGSKIALVGKNGCGKSTLMKWISGELGSQGKASGEVWRHPSLRIGHVTQYSVEELEAYAHMSVVQYAEEQLSAGRASKTIIAEASGNVRQYLGAFGLGGAHAHRPIAKLSGGERMRLCFATVLADQPHMLLLDESTNHVDLETLDSMASALNTYQGAVVMVSHNQGFLSGFCQELWVLENGQVLVKHNDAESFDENFSNYRNHILSSSAASNRRQERRVKTDMAKRAAKHSSGMKKTATFIT